MLAFTRALSAEATALRDPVFGRRIALTKAFLRVMVNDELYAQHMRLWAHPWPPPRPTPLC